MAGHDILVRFWGVRGSYPVPGEKTIKYGGNTSCVEIRARRHIIILDAGTGIINLGHHLLREMQKNRGDLNITMLISHTHHDHIQGLPYFAPAYQTGCILNVYGPKAYSDDLIQVLSRNMEPQYSPIRFDELSSQKNIHNLSDNHLLVLSNHSSGPSVYSSRNLNHDAKKDVLVRIMRSYAHPKDGVFAFRVEVNGKSIVYATDTEGYIGGDTRLIDFARGTNLLIHDAQYDLDEYTDPTFPRQGFGHSTYKMAAEVAQTAEAKNLVLFHHDPSHDDVKLSEMEARTREHFPNATVGYEGLEFTF